MSEVLQSTLFVSRTDRLTYVPVEQATTKFSLALTSPLIVQLRPTVDSLSEKQSGASGFRLASDDELIQHLVRHPSLGIQRPFKLRPKRNSVIAYGNERDPTWANITIMGSCTGACPFCYTDWIRQDPPFETPQLLSIIDRIVSDFPTVEQIVLSGGEATEFVDIVQVACYANSAGLRVAVQTNGIQMHSRSFTRALIHSGGVGAFLISLHSIQPEIHDGILGVPAAFEKTTLGITNALAEGAVVSTNTVVCRSTISGLIDLAEHCAARFPTLKTMRFSNIIVEGAAFRNASGLLVSLDEVAHVAIRLRDAGEKLGVNIELANVPLCIDPQGNLNSSRHATSQRTLVDFSPFYQQNRPRGEEYVKPARCSKCDLLHQCPGIQSAYLSWSKSIPESIVPLSYSFGGREQ